MSLLKSIVYSNIWVAFCAVGYTLHSYFFFKQSPDIPYLLFVFSATLSVYNFHRYIRFFTNFSTNSSTVSERHQWIISHKNLIRFLFFANGFVLLFLFFYLPLKKILPQLLLLGASVVLYIFPFTKKFNGLRHFPYLKTPLIALVWIWVCVKIPLTLQNQFIPYIYLLSQLLFVIAITLPFDIRDITIDKHENVRTFATVLGERTTKILALVLLFLSLFLIFILNNFSLNVKISYLLTVFTTSTFIILTKNNRAELFFSGLMESTLIFPSLFYLLCQFIV